MENPKIHPDAKVTLAPPPAAAVAAAEPLDDGIGIENLWQDALKDYEDRTGIKRDKIPGLVAKEFKGVLEGTEVQKTEYDDQRHPKTKLTQARSTLNSCLDWVVKGSDFVKDHVSGDLTAPAKVLAGAISLLVGAAHEVSSNLDLISETFEDIKTTMEDATNFEEVTPKSNSFRRRLMNAFAALLSFCAFATTIFKNHGRTRLYWRALTGTTSKAKEQADSIKKQSDTVKKAIKELKEAVPWATLGVVAVTDKRVVEVSKQLTGTGKEVTAIGTEVTGLGKQMKDLPGMFVDALTARFDASAFQTTTSSTTLRLIRQTFKTSRATRAYIDAQSDVFGAHGVKATFEWFSADRSCLQWYNANRKCFLQVSGAPGTGKTFFTSYLSRKLRETAKAKTGPKMSVACFFFQKDQQETLQNALNSIIVQIAEQDPKYTDVVYPVLDPKNTKDPKDPKEATEGPTANVKKALADPKEVWKLFIEKPFQKSSDPARTVYILLDSVDNLPREDFVTLFQICENLGSEKHAIQIMCKYPSDHIFHLSSCERAYTFQVHAGYICLESLHFQIISSTDTQLSHEQSSGLIISSLTQLWIHVHG